MKKIYTLAMGLLVSGTVCAQWFNAVTYKGAFPVTDGMTGTSSNDWTAGWANFDPQNAVYAAPTTTVSADITSNTTWATGSVVLLQNKVYVKNGATLTIQPGVTVRGEYATQGTLIISRSAKINAQGTQTSPIVFTSELGVGLRAEGDWGGVIILGSAVMNQPGGVANIEGLTAAIDNEYGGSNDMDSSGIFSYARIEFGGIPLQPNKEINGLTMGSVGSKTKIDHVQVSFGGDDGFEWFGGTVNAKYLISFRNVDDDFDTDFGFRGNIQFGLIIRDKDMSDAAGDSNGFESDNEASSPYTRLPMTQPVFSNITNIGPKRDGTTVLPVGEKFDRGVYIRRNSGTSVFNSLIIGWEKGFRVKDAGTVDNFTINDTAVFANNVISDDVTWAYEIDATSGSTAAFYANIQTTDMIDTLSTVALINFVNGFPTTLEGTPDFRLQNSSVVSVGADFTHPKLGGQVGINSLLYQATALQVYPNPAANQANLLVKLTKEEAITVTLLDMSGKVIATLLSNERIGSGNIAIPVQTSELSNGLYFIQVRSASFSHAVKLVVNH